MLNCEYSEPFCIEGNCSAVNGTLRPSTFDSTNPTVIPTESNTEEVKTTLIALYISIGVLSPCIILVVTLCYVYCSKGKNTTEFVKDKC